MLSTLIEQDVDKFGDHGLEDLKVLVSGYAPDVARALASAFAEARAHVLVQTPHCSRALLDAADRDDGGFVTLEPLPSHSASSAAKYARKASRAPGGLDAVIALVSVTPRERRLILASDDAEEAVHDLLLPVSLVTRVTANRMRVLMKEGSVLAVLVTPPAANPKEAAFDAYARAALSALVRFEAFEWAADGIAVNGVVCGTGEDSAEDVAALAVQIARPQDATLSGHVLDAAGAATLCC